MAHKVPTLSASVKAALRDRIDDIDGEIGDIAFEVQRAREEIDERERELIALETERDEIDAVLEACEANETTAQAA